MRKVSILFLFLMVSVFAHAQVATNIYWIQFADKNNSPYSIDNPEAYLSQRALQRRANLGIAIDEYDIPVNPQYLEAVAACGAELLNPSKWLNGVSVYVTDPAVIDAINALEFVSTVRNCPNNPQAQERKERWLANELKESSKPVVYRDFYGGAHDQVYQLKVNELHEMGFDGTGVVVAVLDGGFQGTEETSCFDNMREEGRLLGTRDFVYGSSSVYTQGTHGTSCLSTMAAYDPNEMVGTAYKASYYLIHTEDGNSETIIEEYNWASGAEYADSLGVDVCTTSLGYINFDDNMSQWNHPFEHFDGHTAPMTIACEIAASRGMICMNAAGNDGGGTCTLGIPGDAEHILTVGAVDANGERADFSSVGPTYDGRIKPDVMAMGESTYVASGYGDWWPYYNGSGTSFATPVLAGAVACLRQARPYASVQEICDAIRACSNRADNPDSYYGYGIPDFTQALELLHINEAPANADEILNVFPNPSKGTVHVAWKEGVDAEVGVFDITGRQLFAFSCNGLNRSTLESYLGSLDDGVYFINVNSETMGRQVVKLVKLK